MAMTFEYSDEQWAKIDACLRRLGRFGRYFDGGCLEGIVVEWKEGSEFISEMKHQDRWALVNAANRYLDQVKTERAPAKRVADLKSIWRTAEELRNAINNLDPREKLGLDQFVVPLTTLENRARCAPSLVRRQLARMALYREVFNLWTGWGGDLLYEQHDGEPPQGPLIAFVQAVIGPIFRERLSPNTIRNRIDAENKARAKEEEKWHVPTRNFPEMARSQVALSNFVWRHFARHFVQESDALQLELAAEYLGCFQELSELDESNIERRLENIERRLDRLADDICRAISRMLALHKFVFAFQIMEVHQSEERGGFVLTFKLVITHPYPPDGAAVRLGAGAARASRMAQREARRAVETHG